MLELRRALVAVMEWRKVEYVGPMGHVEIRRSMHM